MGIMAEKAVWLAAVIWAEHGIKLREGFQSSPRKAVLTGNFRGWIVRALVQCVADVLAR